MADAGVQVEVYDDVEALAPRIVVSLPAMPRVGEYLSVEADGGYFEYLILREVWYRQEGQGGPFRACIRIELDD